MFHLKGSAPSSEKPKIEIEPAPAYSASKTVFASMFIHEGDCIHMLQFPQRDIDTLRVVINQSWDKGIQRERLLYSSCHEFKLHGSPWNMSHWTGSENIPGQVLMREIFACLFSAGWILHARNNGLLIFRQQQTSPQRDWISITVIGFYKLRLIGASAELIALFRDILESMGLLQEDFWKERDNNAWEFKIKGNPRSVFGEEMVQWNLLMLRIVETLEAHGWSLYSNTMQYQQNVCVSYGWFCVKDKQWVPGMTIVRG
ncbi:hypothetical protein OIDMADRAFT_147359 [Oidiodendron maius Zn]|uniref:Uncharacterized protein n=1 Tax=Oidiodendron maius (strain Zn) TaxID=913774 RepID=A0A0C3GP56_OIDMZ|nr:hypothetical protein OIDMADRAFT_147359 [Oidiodendron maius Zn]